MLLELAAGGDLLDKVGIPPHILHCLNLISEDSSGRLGRRRDCPLLFHTDLPRNGSTASSVMIHTQLIVSRVTLPTQDEKPPPLIGCLV